MITLERLRFQAALSERILATDAEGIPSNADKASRISKAIAVELAGRIGATRVTARLAGQTAGNNFEAICGEFLKATFLRLEHLRPGNWFIGSGMGGIQRFEQYSHLALLQDFARRNAELASALGRDYQIAPDLIVARLPEPDEAINSAGFIVDGESALLSRLRASAGGDALLHACVSCKWTIRSDRAQNVRTEALNLIRNRKGPLPHVVAVTGEPMPSRIGSLALGTGDVDCVYHIALPELRASVEALGFEDAGELLDTMINGKRLRDISDLPLDLAI